MKNAVATGTLPAPFFHEGSEAVQFWVWTGDPHPYGASVSRSVLHYRFKGRLDGSDALATYAANRVEIDAAVLRRVASGAREPVMLREHDLPVVRYHL